MKRNVLAGGIASIVFIVLTAMLSQSMDGAFSMFCFYFHLVPFGLGFAGGSGSTTLTIIYYVVLWAALTLLFGLAIRIVTTFRKNSNEIKLSQQ